MALEADYNSERSRVSNGLGTRHAGFRNTAGMEIHVNGEVQQVPAGLTVLGLLEALQLDTARLALELDGQILRQTYWKERVLQPGARLEIVQFVGGG